MLREIYGKHRILKLFEKKQFRLVELVIPYDLYTKMVYIYLLCKSSNVGVTFIIDFIFNFGIDIFITLIEKYNLRNIFHLMKIKEYVMASLDVLFKKKLNRYPLIDCNDIIFITQEFNRLNFSQEQRIEFLTFVNNFDKSFLYKEKLVLDADDLKVLFEAYLLIEKESQK